MNRRKSSLAGTELGRKLTVIFATALLTTDDGGGADGTGGDGGGDGGASGGDGGGGGDQKGGDSGQAGDNTGDKGGDQSDLSSLFAPEEIEARKAEATRRAALSDEERTAEDQAKAEEAAKNAPPEAYADFTVPEGMTLDPVMVEEFKPLAKELGLSQERAQKLVDLASKVQQRTLEGVFLAHEAKKATWLTEAEADDEIGADIKAGAEASVAVRAFNSISQGHPGMKQLVNELGIGNHPEFLRLMYRIGKNMREDTFESGGSGGKDDAAYALYPSMRK